MAVLVSRVDLSGEHAVIIKTAFHRGQGTVLSLSHRGVYIATNMRILPQRDGSSAAVPAERYGTAGRGGGPSAVG